MLRKKYSLFILILLIFTSFYESCHRDSPVTLEYDFSSRDIWKYALSVDIGGTFSWSDSVSNLTSNLNCLLLGENTAESGCLKIMTDTVGLISNILDDIEIQNIKAQIEDVEYKLDLNNSFQKLLDSAIAPVSGFGEWDLYRQLVKVIPSLPENPVRPGFSWERERSIPIATSHGVLNCNIYQSFTFDSLKALSNNRQAAYISWLFRYAVDQKQPDTAGVLHNFPHTGKGKGNAVLDIKEKTLLSASMILTKPVCSLKNLSILWKEKASLVLVD